MPASAMVLAIFRWVIARDQGQRGLPAAFASVEQSVRTSSRARSRSGGIGTSRQRSARRFRVPCSCSVFPWERKAFRTVMRREQDELNTICPSLSHSEGLQGKTTC